MKKSVSIGAILILLFALLIIGLPWLAAYRSYSSASGYLGLQGGKRIQFVYVDKTHFDAYKTALWFDESLSIIGKDGEIYCNGKRIGFPEGKNLALVLSPEGIIFTKLDDEYFLEGTGESEIIYVLGKVPHFKDRDKGRINLQKAMDNQVIQKEWAAFIGVPTSTGIAQPVAAPDSAKPSR